MRPRRWSRRWRLGKSPSTGLGRLRSRTWELTSSPTLTTTSLRGTKCRSGFAEQWQAVVGLRVIDAAPGRDRMQSPLAFCESPFSLPVFFPSAL